tara:strand:- start:79 stop:450 length:372 start_codon:yes stop_codon:yes gene_type:complete
MSVKDKWLQSKDTIPAYKTVIEMVGSLNDIINDLQGYEDGYNHNPVGLTAIEEEIRFEYGYVSKRLQDFLNESMNLITYCHPNYKEPSYTLIGLKECLIEVSKILERYHKEFERLEDEEDSNG